MPFAPFILTVLILVVIVIGMFRFTDWHARLKLPWTKLELRGRTPKPPPRRKNGKRKD